MLAQHMPWPSVYLLCALAGAGAVLAVQHLVIWYNNRQGAATLWLGALSASLAAQMGVTAWVLKAAPDQFNEAMFVRVVLNALAIVLFVPTAAAFSGRAWPRWSMGLLVAVAVAYVVLWGTTDLVYAHRLSADAVPVYGPLRPLLASAAVLLATGTAVWLARGWEDHFERRTFLAGLALGVATGIAAVSLPASVLVDTINAYWLMPGVVVIQVLFVRRALKTEAATTALVQQRGVALAGLARSERRSRLALRSGGMGWFEYDPVTRELETSAELAAMLDRRPADRPRTVDAVVGLVHPDDRARVRAGLEHAEEHGTGGVEARLVTGDGKTLWAEMSALRTLVDEDRSEVVGVVRDVSTRKAAEAEQLRMASTDALTGLPNRAALAEQARQALGAGERFSLVLMDLDSFKDVNDTLGHQVGDQVLVAVAARLAANLRDGDFLARLGGDEFAVVVPEAGVKAMELARRLLGALHGPVEVDGVAVSVRASAGLVSAPEDGSDVGTLLRRADSAMYSAKGRDSRVQGYAGDDLGAARRLQLAGQLPTALAGPEVQVHYQPTVELATTRCEVVEALVRWHHPLFGPVPPVEFVPLAEQYGLGFQLLRRVLSDALSECARWRAAGTARSVAVNVSPRTLVDPDMVALVATELTRAGLPAEALVLEMTEDAFACDGPGTRDAIAKLHDLGVRVAIDDFGTGYSSLSYLKQLPVSYLKIDRSFVAGLGSEASDDAIVSLAVDIGHRLGMRVVGEGVETEDQFEALRRYGCDTGQGYWICRPGPSDVIGPWLASYVTRRPVPISRHLRAVGEGNEN